MKIYKNNFDSESIAIEKELNNYRGFVTIATGSEKYHKMAYTLLLSYRMTSKNPCRFAVITDKESLYTEYFDDVIVVTDATRTYMDKVSLLVNSPYRETIFIDADCIAFSDLNEYWKCFENATDLSCFGRIMSLDASDGWYSSDSISQYKDRVNHVLDIHGGIYFIRKGDVCEKIFKDSQDIIHNYESFSFRRFKKPADEPVLALAMAINQCNPISSETRNYAWLRRTKKIKADFFSQKLSYYFGNSFTNNGMLMHFGTSRTIGPLYLIESSKVHFFYKNKRCWNSIEKVFNYFICYSKALFLGICFSWRKLLKIMNI